MVKLSSCCLEFGAICLHLKIMRVIIIGDGRNRSYSGCFSGLLGASALWETWESFVKKGNIMSLNKSKKDDNIVPYWILKSYPLSEVEGTLCCSLSEKEAGQWAQSVWDLGRVTSVIRAERLRPANQTPETVQADQSEARAGVQYWSWNVNLDISWKIHLFSTTKEEFLGEKSF